MRPLFCRIITFPAARVMRNTPRRFVSSTWSQSSSFIRTSSWSRVMPALFTSTSMRPKRSFAASTRRSASSRLAASAATASALAAQCFQLFRRTLEPARIAARDYHGSPVVCQRAGDRQADSARPAGDHRHPAGQRLRLAHAPAPARERGDRVLSSDAASSTECPRAPSRVRLSRPVSTRPGPTSTHTSAPLAGQARDAVRPAHRAGHLPDEERLHLFGGGGDPRIHVAHHRDARRGHRGSLELGGEPVRGGLHQRAVEGRAHREQHALLARRARPPPSPRAPPRRGARR